MADRFLYFGYGSNRLTARLEGANAFAGAARTWLCQRTASHIPQTSDDGSGKGDMETTNDAGDRVEGVLFWISSLINKGLGAGGESGIRTHSRLTLRPTASTRLSGLPIPTAFSRTSASSRAAGGGRRGPG